MKYMLKTEKTDKGRLVFSTQGTTTNLKYYVYDEENNQAWMPRKWVMINKRDIVNLKYQNGRITPVSMERTLPHLQAK